MYVCVCMRDNKTEELFASKTRIQKSYHASDVRRAKKFGAVNCKLFDF